jgi:glycolate oxidase FAD binding subunit
VSLDALQERIREAARLSTPLRLRGGGSKDFYGNEPRGELLDTHGYAGIVSYEPTELVITARCGTPLHDVEKLLADQLQCLPFEPPHFGREATLGGCVAAGLSGPRRASAGALRDFVLGVKLIDGRGRALGFGGQVMKNVAGYDVARLAAGSLGTLGLIAEVSFKVLPLPARELTVHLEMTEERALEAMNRWAGQPLPISATAWLDGHLAVRLSGSSPGVHAAAERIGGTRIDGSESEAFWQRIREQTDPFFSGTVPLWRVALPSVHPPLGIPGTTLIEWGGGLRWIRAEASVRDAVQRAGGHATLFRARQKKIGAFTPLDPVVMRLHRELKAAFDPAGILNPGRMYPEL